MKKVLLLIESSAFASHKSRESHDLLLALAAVEHQVSVLYRDAGVTQLSANANEGSPCKDFTKSQKLFALYDIEQIYACAQSLAFYRLEASTLNIKIHSLELVEQQQLISQFDEVIIC